MLAVLIILFFPYLTIAQDYYDQKYDYYDIDSIYQNPRLLKKYMDCFLDKGPCAPVGRVFKSLLPEVVMTVCAKCSPAQRRFVCKALEAFDKYLPNDRDELRKKIDPQSKYFELFFKETCSKKKANEQAAHLMFGNHHPTRICKTLKESQERCQPLKKKKVLLLKALKSYWSRNIAGDN